MIDEIEDIEESCLDRRYQDDVLDTARDVEEFFDSLEDAASFAKAYDSVYDRRNPGYDPEGYVAQWADSFDGDMSGITGSLRE